MAEEAAAAAAVFKPLPKTVLPQLYKLRIEPDFETFTFEGRVEIAVQVCEAVDAVLLQGKELTIASASVRSAGDEEAKEAAVSVEDTGSFDLLRLTRDDGQQFAAGDAVLTLTYSGKMGDNLVGFYRSKYEAAGGVHWLGSTQFEATDARRALPCFDEPDFKAVFQLTLVVATQLKAVSNTPVAHISTDLAGGKQAVTFQKTPVMSTYLLAWVIGQFDVLTGRTASGVEVRCFGVPGKLDKLSFALRVAEKVLDFFGDYFGIAYPLAKCDMLAIPDFAAGAMENWGCITYREIAILIDEKASSTALKLRVAEVVAHELAHQWFGNLVTMKWWNDLWLNEGFATWAGTLAVDYCFPEWDVWTQFTSNEYRAALSVDSLAGSHPVEVPIADPDEIDQVFDALSYYKGASVIRQLQAQLGADAFRAGLQVYLKRHAYDNARTTDLWQALEESSGQPVVSMMAAWTGQVGYPVLRVEAAGDGKFKLTQRRFLASGVPDGDCDSWPIPLSMLAAGAEGGAVKMDTISDAEQLVELPAADWVKLNAGQTTIVRVAYTAEQWAALSRAVESKALPPVDRLGIVQDAAALVEAGELPADTLLTLLAGYVNEDDYTVWQAVASSLDKVYRIVVGSDYVDAFKAYARKLFATVGAAVGWEKKDGESDLTSLLRALVLSSLVKYGDEDAAAAAASRFDGYVADASTVAPDLVAVVLSATVASGADGYAAVRKLYDDSDDTETKLRALAALASAKDADTIKEYLQWGLLSGDVRIQDSIYVTRRLATSSVGAPIAWQFVKDNFAALHEKLTTGGLGMARGVFLSPPSNFNKEEQAADVAAFFEEHELPEISMELARVVEAIRNKAAWAARDGAAIKAYLESA